MSIYSAKSDHPSKLDEILRLIWELPVEDHEVLWQWFDEHEIVNDQIVEKEKN